MKIQMLMNSNVMKNKSYVYLPLYAFYFNSIRKVDSFHTILDAKN